jgi:pimeloyl-ACP methyl ester carboxylesterase
MKSMPTTVLLHGAGTGAWIWDRVGAELERPWLALELGARTEGVTPRSCADELVRRIDAWGAENVVVVAHSLAGVLAADLAEELGERLRRIIFVSAVIPPHGSTFARTLGFPASVVLPILFRLNTSGLRPSESMIRRELCNDLDEKDAAMVVQRYQAERPGLYLTPVTTAADLPPSVYIRLTRDRSVTPSHQDRTIERLISPRVYEIDAGHLVMLSRPAELAAILNREIAGS